VEGIVVAELPSGTVTFLFTDLVVSTRLWEQEPDAMSAALARHDEILRGAIVANGGHLVKGRGDGVHAVFATAAGAVRAAIDGQLSLGSETWPVSEPLLVRVGIHTGVAEMRDDDYFGSAVNRAARLEGIAHGGQIVASQATEALVRDELGDDVELVDLGEHRLRDLSRAERVFQVRAPGLLDAFPALRSLEAYPGNLPAQLTSFVGRDEEIAALEKALDESRLVTLTGVGGVGKTRLALRVAAEVLPSFADGAWLCELATTNDPDALGQVIGAALSVQPRPGRSLLESACDYLTGKQALIVLDNCEHLLDAAAEVADAILHAAAGVRVLATSRELLGVPGERVVGVRSLPLPSESGVAAIAACEAVRLFVDRAAATRSGFRIDDTNAAAIVEICTRLDGIPLAVELAAARVTSMTPSEIAALLDERFRLLTGGHRRGIERQQTLRATVEWSYSLLGERERLVFDRLAVFAGSFDADAASAVAGDDELAAWDVRDAIDDLAAKSMLDVVEDRPDDMTRFRLLETLRQYALERLDDSDHAEDHRRRYAEHYAAFAEAAGPGLEGSDEAAWVGRFDAELDNLRAAVAWALDSETPADAELGLRIIAALVGQSFYRPAAGVGEWAEAALPRAEASTRGRRCAVLTAAAWKSVLEGDLDLARTRASEALRDGLPADTPSPGWVHSALAGADSFAGNHPQARQTLAAGRRALDAIRAPDYAQLELDLNGLMGRSLAGQLEDARAPAEDALRRARTLANPSQLIVALRWYAGTRRADETDETIQALEECLAHSRAVATPDAPDVLQPLGLLAKLRAHRRERAPAIEALRDGVVRAHDSGQLVMLAFVLSCGVNVAIDLDAPEFAATLGGAVSDGSLAGRTYIVDARVRADGQAALDHARAQLRPDLYDAARASGIAMSYNEIVEYALSELDRLLAETTGS
jgi:predicted ATPase/class 3 adenylate cyclase